MLPAARAAIYEADNTTHVADLLIEPVEPGPGGRAPSAIETARTLSEIEDGQIIVQTDHPEAAELTPGRVIRVTEGGVSRPPFTITRPKRKHLAPNHRGEKLTVTGKTLLDRWRKSTVDPWVGLSRRPYGAQRIWDCLSPTFDDSSWTQVYNQDRTYAATQGMIRPRAWIDPYSSFIWSRATSDTQPVGKVPFRRHFTLDSEKLVVFFFSADNDYRVTLDGVDLHRAPLPYPEFTWQKTFRAAVRVPAGDHVFGAIAENWSTVGSTNPAGFICSAHISDGTTVTEMLFGTGSDTGNPLIGEWLTLDYPDPMPGFTPGEIILRQLVECQDSSRDELDGWTCSFDGAEDSNGNPWTNIPQHAVETECSAWDLLESLASTWIDIDTDDEGLVLHAYDKAAGGAGSVLSIDLENGTNIVELTEDQDIDEQANSVVCKYKGGFRRRQNILHVAAHGRMAATLELGELEDVKAVDAIGDAYVELYKEPATTWLVDVIESAGKTPGTDFNVGDWITLNGGDPVRVMSIRWALRSDGSLRPILQVSSLFEHKAKNRRRHVDRLVSMAGGGFGAAAPIMDTGSKIPIGELGDVQDITWSGSDEDTEDGDLWPKDQPKQVSRVYEAVIQGDWWDDDESEQISYGDTEVQVLDRGTPVPGLELITLGENEEGATVATWLLHVTPESRLRMKMITFGGHENLSLKLKCSEPV